MRARRMRHVAITAIVAGCLVSTGAPMVGGLGASIATAPTAPKPRPDIVLVTIDALRADHLSAHGYRRFTSPAIDRLASRGVRFTNAITQAPYTKAAIASLMSGLYPSAHKTVTATVPFAEAMSGHPTTTPVSTDVLPGGITTLAEALRDAGYRTLGFTANPFLIEAFGFGQGFDVFQFYPGADFAGADRLVDEALTAVEGSSGDPVFLWVHVMEPHSPYDPPRWASAMFALDGAPRLIPNVASVPAWLVPGTPADLRVYERNYDGEIAAADAAVDTLLREFGQIRGRSNTVTVVTADHGEQFLDHGGFEHNTTLYDELIHIPLVLDAPSLSPAVVDAQVELVDLYPTLLGAAGAPMDDMPGHDLLAAASRTGTRRPAFAENGPLTAVRMDGWKLIRHDTGFEELYDLRTDPHEQRNLIDQRGDRAAPLRSVLAGHAAASIERGKAIRSESAPVSPSVLDRLRALGYVAR
jgi:arylsulfatase A-like enzyme